MRWAFRIENMGILESRIIEAIIVGRFTKHLPPAKPPKKRSPNRLLKVSIVLAMSTSPIRMFSEGILIDQPWGKLTWLAFRELGNSSTMTFGHVIIPAGQTNPRHRHPNCDEILHLITGRLEHSLGAEKFLLNPGDTISIPAGQWHNAHALDGKDAEMVICFSSADRETEFEG